MGETTEAMLWRPKGRHDLASFQAEVCAHCLDRNGEGDWEDEFGNDTPGECVLIHYAFAGPTLHWTIKDGRRDCCCFVEDPANPPRCPLTKEMF
ncbi:hypothetical protein [Mesorhizobium sp. DCY119]|uniref:hypothetical protein n=1 Tax=Mesorhizobium sp. DCY119 TaxID=2108445 RepID=UPI000E6CA983|nr:hypothetical protein [Mesorhizobium sp. DCY119]RJG46531.1 hypothetical protein D3Y55_21290 [Mesorhizobium sp. DCY119]